MPTRARRYCLSPGCPELTNSARCPNHTTSHEQQDQRTRGTAHERGYTKAWSRIRARKLRANPLCEYCERGTYAPQRVTVATEVDHITPLDRGGTHEDTNLASACHSCHMRKTADENAKSSNGKGIGARNPQGRNRGNRSPAFFAQDHIGVSDC